MLRNVLAGTTAFALIIAFAASGSANPTNKFDDNNTAAAAAMAYANANGGDANSGAVATATAYAESFSSDIEVISVQEMTATVNAAPIVVFGGIGGAGMAGTISSGATTVAAGAGTFGGIANMNVASGYFNSALGGVSLAGTGPSSRDGAQQPFSLSLSGR